MRQSVRVVLVVGLVAAAGGILSTFGAILRYQELVAWLALAVARLCGASAELCGAELLTPHLDLRISMVCAAVPQLAIVVAVSLVLRGAWAVRAKVAMEAALLLWCANVVRIASCIAAGTRSMAEFVLVHNWIWPMLDVCLWYYCGSRFIELARRRTKAPHVRANSVKRAYKETHRESPPSHLGASSV